MPIPKEFCSEFVVYYLADAEVEYGDDGFGGRYANNRDAFENHKKYSLQDVMLSFFVGTHGKGNKAYEKRIETASSWAENRSGYSRLFLKSECTTVQNVPMHGFTFLNTTRRYSTSNVLFRILHPEGYIFEISSENAMDIIENCTIENGVIKEAMFFDNTKYLLNEKLHKYKEHYKKLEVLDQALKIELGDVCIMEVSSQYTKYYIKKIAMQFLGKLHCLCLGEVKSSEYFVFRDNNDAIFACNESGFKKHFKEFSELEFGEVSCVQDSIDIVTEAINKTKLYNIHVKKNAKASLHQLALVGTEPIKASDTEFSFSLFKGGIQEVYDSDRLAVNTENGMYCCVRLYGYSEPRISIWPMPKDSSTYFDTPNINSRTVYSHNLQNLLDTGMIFTVGLKKK